MSKAGDGCYRALGLMSGTSMDGIDVAVIETDGRGFVERGAARSYAYPEDFRARLRAAAGDAVGLSERSARPGCLAEVEAQITARHVDAVVAFLSETGIASSDLDVIGFHGHTVLHRPEAGLTVQLGDGALLAERLGVDVVHDLRVADCAAGGQGAPLVPVYHAALASRLPVKPAVFVNVGGVANVTSVRSGVPHLAFDCGPGNALIDDWMAERAGQAYDADGALAACGAVDENVVKAFLAHAFFAAPAPKSLDRNAFGCDLVAHLSTTDGAATLTAITAAGIAKVREFLGQEPQIWVVSGGGRKNRTLMEMLAWRVQNAVVPAEAVGLDGDSLEAEAWAYLAVRSLLGLPITFPGTTGVGRPLTGGVLARAPGQ